MEILNDLKTVLQLAKPVKGSTHAERIENFYRHQADGYDQFRKKLLWGREALMEEIDFTLIASWVDVGAGTGANLESAVPRFNSLKSPPLTTLVDLSPSLLARAQERISNNSWNFVNTLEADATKLPMKDESVDLVTFSYSLTMIPDWFKAVNEAKRILKPGGQIAAVDFYSPRKHSTEAGSWSQRSLWPLWFAMDNVFLSQDMLPYLKSDFQESQSITSKARVPFLMGLKVPVFRFIGLKKPG